MEVPMSPDAAITAGAVLLAVTTIAFGGTFVLRVVTGGQPATALQKAFFRAGHAHAGVLVILGLVVVLLMEAVDAGLPGRLAAGGVLACAIIIPAGFFFSPLGKDRERPNRLIALLWVGFGLLCLSVVVAGVVLLAYGIPALG